jgi:hypothetical protein
MYFHDLRSVRQLTHRGRGLDCSEFIPQARKPGRSPKPILQQNQNTNGNTLPRSLARLKLDGLFKVRAI